MLNEIMKVLKISAMDIEDVAKNADVDVTKAMKFLESLFDGAEKIDEEVSEVYSIVNPTLGKEIISVGLLIGTIDSIVEIMAKLNMSNSITSMSNIYKDIDALDKIWKSQKILLSKIYAELFDKNIITLKKGALK